MRGHLAIPGLFVYLLVIVIGSIVSINCGGDAANTNATNANRTNANRTFPSPQASQIPTNNVNPTPTSVPQDRWETMRSTLETELRTGGRLAFDPPESMVQGSSATVTARIATQEIGPELTSGFRNPDRPADEIKVSPVMKVILFSDDGAFAITGKSSEEQILASPYTQWEWQVQALQSGRHKLRLQVVASIKTSDRGEKPLDITVANKEIAVDVNYKYMIGSFVSNPENWKYLIGSTSLLTILGVILGWLRNRSKKASDASPDDPNGKG